MRNLFKRLSLFVLVTLPLFSSAVSVAEEEVDVSFGRTYTASWETWYPYEFIKEDNNATTLTGLDIQLVKAFAKNSHVRIEFKEMDWHSTLSALREGKLDLASGATFSAERASYVYYSKPYRYEESALFVRSNNASLKNITEVSEFLGSLKKNQLRLGVKAGAVYSEPLLNEFIANPDNRSNIVLAENDKVSLERLIKNEIDGFIADKMVGSALVWHAAKGKGVSELDFKVKTPVHLIFSKKTVSEKTVQDFNNAIENLSNKEVYSNIVSWYLYPSILLQTIDTNWFHTLDMLGTIFFSISGVLIANALRASILSAFVYALLPALGGGILRDMLFGQRPPEVLKSPLYLCLVCGIVIAGFCITKILEKRGSGIISKHKRPIHKKIATHFKLVLTLCDALGLAAFTVTGVMISLMARAEPIWLWGPFFSFLTGAAGTILRDILSKKEKLADIEGEIYSEIAIVWGLFLSLGLLYNLYNMNTAVIQGLVWVTVIGAFTTHMLFYFYKVPNVYFK